MFKVAAELTGFSRIDFDRKKVRQAMRRAGRDVQKEARRLVARRAVSEAGQYPGKRSGDLQRSIQVTVSRSGFLVRVGPLNKSGKMKVFYPAILFYGHRGQGIGKLAAGMGVGSSNRRRRGERARAIAERSGRGFVLEPRGNYMVDALDTRRAAARAGIAAALQDALIPRK